MSALGVEVRHHTCQTQKLATWIFLQASINYVCLHDGHGAKHVWTEIVWAKLFYQKSNTIKFYYFKLFLILNLSFWSDYQKTAHFTLNRNTVQRKCGCWGCWTPNSFLGGGGSHKNVRLEEGHLKIVRRGRGHANCLRMHLKHPLPQSLTKKTLNVP